MQKKYKIAILPGDGIGPEVIKAAVTVLDGVQKALKDICLVYVYGEAGYNCIHKYKTNIPKHTIEMMKNTDACLKGPLTTSGEVGAPPSASVTIRKTFNLYANIRPCKTLTGIHALKTDIDLLVLRENTQGLYYGKEFEITPGKGVALRLITKEASEKIANLAFKLALNRKMHVTCVHKRNILRITGGIFRNAVFEIAKKYPTVRLDEVHIDAMAMRLIKEPEKYDVIVTPNMFGDILSDEAAQLVGGLGVVAGANIGEKYGMFEPVHGSAPKYAGKNRANPLAAIFAAKMMMEYLEEMEASKLIEKAINSVLMAKKVRTRDIGGSSTTQEFGETVAKKISKISP